MTQPKIITIDGPTASGKGTIAQLLAERLSWQYLDSGLLYRAIGFLAATKCGQRLKCDDSTAIELTSNDIRALIDPLPLELRAGQIWHRNQNITLELRNEVVGHFASQIATHEIVREKLLHWQREFANSHDGIVADGRDMGTVVFPNAPLKVYLEADINIRVQRRLEQLKAQGQSVTIEALFLQIQQRDNRDQQRSIAPLRPAVDAVIINTDSLTPDLVVAKILGQWSNRVR